jgi:hypothetical protein
MLKEYYEQTPTYSSVLKLTKSVTRNIIVCVEEYLCNGNTFWNKVEKV